MKPKSMEIPSWHRMACQEAVFWCEDSWNLASWQTGLVSRQPAMGRWGTHVAHLCILEWQHELRWPSWWCQRLVDHRQGHKNDAHQDQEAHNWMEESQWRERKHQCQKDQEHQQLCMISEKRRHPIDQKDGKTHQFHPWGWWEKQMRLEEGNSKNGMLEKKKLLEWMQSRCSRRNLKKGWNQQCTSDKAKEWEIVECHEQGVVGSDDSQNKEWKKLSQVAW